MKYSVGDKILVIQSDEEGSVLEIINDKMVMIQVNGVSFPVYTDQIDFPYYKMFTKKKISSRGKPYIDNIKTEKTPSRKKVRDGVFINFVPVYDKDIFDDDVVEKLKVYLVNHNEESYTFKYRQLFSGELAFELSSELGGLNDFYLNDIDFESVSDSPAFEFEFSLSKPDKKKMPFYERMLKLRGKQIFGKIEEIKKNNEGSFSYELFLLYPDKVMEVPPDVSRLEKAGFRVYDASRAKDHLPPARTELDLHIDKITDHWERMSGSEMLELQLSTFEKYLELAHLHHLPEMVVIHGIGEGLLKKEIHQRLQHKAFVKSFVNRYHARYGYGATEIFLKM